MGSEAMNYKLDEKVWEPIILDACAVKPRKFSIAEANSALMKELTNAHLMHCVYGRYVLVETGLSFGLEYTDNSNHVRGNIVSFGIDPEEIDQVILRREIKHAIQINASAEQKKEPPAIVTEKNKSEIAFEKMLSQWVGSRDGDGATFTFKKDIVLYCLQNDIICGWYGSLNADKIRLKASPQKSSFTSTQLEDGIRWCLNDGYKKTVATTNMMTTLEKKPDIIYEHVYPIVCVYTGLKTDMEKLRAFYNMIEYNRKMFARGLKEEQEEEDQKVKDTHPQDDFLASTNFYDVVRDQMKVNSSQSAFYFKKTGNMVDDDAFARAIDSNSQWKERWLPGVHACFLRNGNQDAMEGWAFIIIIVIFMALITVGAMFWVSYANGNNGVSDDIANISIITFIGTIFADVIGVLCYQLFLERRAKQLIVRKRDQIQ